MTNLFSKYQPVLLPVIVIITVLMLSIFGGKNLLARINALRDEISKISAEEQSLQEKLTTLQDRGHDVLPYSEGVVKALPPINPSIQVLSQIRSKAQEHSLVIDNLTIDTQMDANQDQSVTARFNLKGDYVGIMNYLVGAAHWLPLVNITTLGVNKNSGSFEAEVALQAFWKPFPEDLPPVTAAIEDLSQEEKDLIEELSAFSSPTFQALPPAQQEPETQRTDPFSL